MSFQIYAPGVHLFAYHLRQTEPNQNRALLDRGEAILNSFGIQQSIKIKDREGYRVNLLETQTEENASLGFKRWTHSPLIGIAYPVRLHDTYALALNVRRPEKDQEDHKTETVPVEFFRELHAHDCWLPTPDNSFLGQTTLLTAWYTPEKTWQFWKSRKNKKNLKELADKCLQAFLPPHFPEPPLYRTGELFDSPIFEYGNFERESNNCQILVWIFCTPETDEKLSEQYSNLLDLFCHRHKVVKAYQDTGEVKQLLNKKLQQIEQEITTYEDLPIETSLTLTNLRNLKSQLKRLPRLSFDYEDALGLFSNYLITLEANAQNYERELEQIYQQLPEDDLKFLASFSQNYRLFQSQIQLEINYFQAAGKPIEKALEAIRGRLQTEQAERDRSLETKIQFLGVGLATTATVSAAIGAYKEVPYTINTQKPLNPHPTVINLLVSLIVGAIAGFITWLIVRPRDRSSK